MLHIKPSLTWTINNLKQDTLRMQATVVGIAPHAMSASPQMIRAIAVCPRHASTYLPMDKRETANPYRMLAPGANAQPGAY